MILHARSDHAPEPLEHVPPSPVPEFGGDGGGPDDVQEQERREAPVDDPRRHVRSIRLGTRTGKVAQSDKQPGADRTALPTRPTWNDSLKGCLSSKETGMAAPRSVEDYLAALPEESRIALERLRKTIKAAAPKATETISYQMPTFKDQGRFLVSYAAFKDHCSLFPASEAVMEALGEELKPYFSGKGTLRFTADKPIPAGLVRKIVKTRIEEIAADRRS
jgi:uncharacterized protein YdhG (YjbR/CyaY superfamily)